MEEDEPFLSKPVKDLVWRIDRGDGLPTFLGLKGAQIFLKNMKWNSLLHNQLHYRIIMNLVIHCNFYHYLNFSLTLQLSNIALTILSSTFGWLELLSIAVLICTSWCQWYVPDTEL